MQAAVYLKNGGDSKQIFPMIESGNIDPENLFWHRTSKIYCETAEKPAQGRTQTDSAQKERGKGDLIMRNFTFEEMNLMCIYNTGSRTELIEALTEMRGYLTPEETELRELTDSALQKLQDMSDSDFAELELYPDFDE